MKKLNLLLFVLLAVAAALLLSNYLQQFDQQQQPAPAQPIVSPPQIPPKQPIVHYPVPETQPDASQPAAAAEKPTVAPKEPELPLPEELPAIEASDQSFQESLTGLKLKRSLFKLLQMENLIQRLVTCIDSLPEKKLPRAGLPLFPPKGKFMVSGTGDNLQISSKNADRYSKYVQLLEALDQDLVLKIYVYFYPLFQAAYEQLGYKNAYFNDRLVFVLGHLLETPNPPEPILLTHPQVLYTYADPLLEQRSAGQKILLRIGSENRQKVLKILAAYRDRLVALHP